jgi:hypothetical protein
MTNVATGLINMLRFQGRSGPSLRLNEGAPGLNACGVRQSVNQELRLLAQQGVLSADYGYLTILDLRSLPRMA